MRAIGELVKTVILIPIILAGSVAAAIAFGNELNRGLLGVVTFLGLMGVMWLMRINDKLCVLVAALDEEEDEVAPATTERMTTPRFKSKPVR